MTWNHLSASGRQKNKPEYLSEFELAHELADRFQARYKRKRLNRQVRIERVTQGSLSVFQHKKAISAAQANDAKARENLTGQILMSFVGSLPSDDQLSRIGRVQVGIGRGTG